MKTPPIVTAQEWKAARQQLLVKEKWRVPHTSSLNWPSTSLRQPVQQRGQECPVAWGEPWTGRAQSPLQDRDLVPQHQDLRVLVLVTYRQQPE